MTTERLPDAPADPGATTAAHGTPYPVDLSLDRRGRRRLALLLGGPVIWITHFMVVYLVAEAGCTGSGHGLDVFDPPVPRVVTIAATIAALAASLLHARFAARSVAAARGDDPESEAQSSLAAIGAALALLFTVPVLLAGIAATWLGSC